MKKIYLICILTLCLFSGCLMQEDESKLLANDKLQLKDFEVTEIKMFQPMAKIIKRFGKPQKIKSFYDGRFMNYIYPDLDIVSYTPENDNHYIVGGVIIKKKGIKTYRGVSVGDKESHVIYHYGKTEKIGEQKDTLDYQVWFDDTPYGIYFTIKNRKVATYMVYIPED